MDSIWPTDDVVLLMDRICNCLNLHLYSNEQCSAKLLMNNFTRIIVLTLNSNLLFETITVTNPGYAYFSRRSVVCYNMLMLEICAPLVTERDDVYCVYSPCLRLPA